MLQDFTPSQAKEFFSRPFLIELINEYLSDAASDFEIDHPDQLEDIEKVANLNDYPDELLRDFADLYWLHIHDASYKLDDEVDANYMERADLILAYYNLPTYFND